MAGSENAVGRVQLGAERNDVEVIELMQGGQGRCRAHLGTVLSRAEARSDKVEGSGARSSTEYGSEVVACPIPPLRCGQGDMDAALMVPRAGCHAQGDTLRGTPGMVVVRRPASRYGANSRTTT